MLEKELKEVLLWQVEGIYAKAQPNVTEEEILERIEMFDMVLQYSPTCEVESLKTVGTDIINLLKSVQKTTRMEINSTTINLIEPYLRLLCYLVDKKRFYDRNTEMATLLKLYRDKSLDVLNTQGNPERTEYYEILTRRDERGEPFIYGDPRHAENLLKEDKEVFPFVQTYCMRNATIHYQISPEDKWEHFFSMFYTMIESTYKHKNRILSIYIEKEISRKEYINKIIKKYEEKEQNNFTYIPLNIDIASNEQYDFLLEKYQETLETLTFEAITKDLEKGDIPFPKIKLIGYAGMGKTTTLEHTIYKEAKKVQKNNYQGNLPVLIEMIKVNQKSQSIESLLADQLGIKNNLVLRELIQKNQVDLYLDGINEINIPNRYEKKEYLEELETFLLKNTKIKGIVTDRDSNEVSILNTAPTFVLTGVTEKTIFDFIRGNSTKPEKVEKQIREKLEKNPSFMTTLKNPFMLKNLITIIECNKEIPEYEEDIAEEFLKAIIERERIQKRDYNAPHILRLLIYVVNRYIEENQGVVEENMMISYYKLMDFFNEYCDKYKKKDPFDNDEMLNLIIKLGILKEVDTEKYTFVDEKYYNFFYFSAAELL